MKITLVELTEQKTEHVDGTELRLRVFTDYPHEFERRRFLLSGQPPEMREFTVAKLVGELPVVVQQATLTALLAMGQL
jgi:hypothetical protein